MVDLGPLVCPLLDESMKSDIENLENEGIKCKVGCNENLSMDCDIPEESCDEMNEFCSSDTSFSMNVPLDVSDADDMVMAIELRMCSTYTKIPDDLDDLLNKRACFSLDMEVNILEILMGEVSDNPEDIVSITGCAATIGEGVCTCKICDEGIGINLSCPGGLVSEECTDIDTTTATTTLTRITDSDGSGTGEVSDAMSTMIRFTRKANPDTVDDNKDETDTVDDNKDEKDDNNLNGNTGDSAATGLLCSVAAASTAVLTFLPILM